ncbi:hypothetical protein [Bradyrhizobium sp. AZCC 2230]|uniref:hypothetical protein n=1 Tax=Bradyrhizobium sp. AZCC 2230 TaxID=3117021 RepID=UPI002FF23F7C
MPFADFAMQRKAAFLADKNGLFEQPGHAARSLAVLGAALDPRIAFDAQQGRLLLGSPAYRFLSRKRP